MIEIKNYTQLDEFLVWKTKWEFSFKGKHIKITEYKIFFSRTSWDTPLYTYFINEFRVWYFQTKVGLTVSLKNSMYVRWFKDQLSSVKDVINEKSSFDDTFDSEEKVDVKKEVSRIQDFLNYFLNGKWKLAQIKENRWILSYKFLWVGAIYKEYTITFLPQEQVFSIWGSGITWTREQILLEQILLDLIASEKYRNDVINRFDAMADEHLK